MNGFDVIVHLRRPLFRLSKQCKYTFFSTKNILHGASWWILHFVCNIKMWFFFVLFFVLGAWSFSVTTHDIITLAFECPILVSHAALLAYGRILCLFHESCFSNEFYCFIGRAGSMLNTSFSLENIA